MRILFLCLIISFFLNGCGTTGQIFKCSDGEKELIYELELNKEGALSYKDDKVEIQMDSRKPTLWERFITPIFKSANEKAQASAGIN